jgi:UDP-N-acetylmuramoylalanine--D-glutamate ligase
MGLGRYLQGSGIGAVKFLMRHGAQVTITDLQTEEDLKDSIAEVECWFKEYSKELTVHQPVFVMGEHREQDFADVDFVVRNPGVPRESKYLKMAAEKNIPILSDVAIFYQLCPCPFMAVTGAKGKSTTTSMIGQIFSATDPKTVVAGNITVSPLEHLDQILAENEKHPIVLELSSWLLETLEDVERGPEIAVLTNLYPEHLNRYKSYDDYKAAKEIIFKHQGTDQWSVLNYDQDDVRQVAERVPSQIVWFSKNEIDDENAVFVRGSKIVVRLNGSEDEIMGVDQLGAQGDHNLENALASIAVASISQVPAETIVSVLSEFKGIADRQEIIREVNGVTYVNDTTATAPAGAVAALRRFSGNDKRELVLLAGGASKNLPYDSMVEEIKKVCKFVILFEGEATDELEEMIGDAVLTQRVGSMSEAVQVASEKADGKGVVLLSPGCASFGMFKNEFDRGDQFKDEVTKL